MPENHGSKMVAMNSIETNPAPTPGVSKMQEAEECKNPRPKVAGA